jgi:hypothetical protein
MNRRTALKFFTITSAAAMLLPGCLSDSKKVSVALDNLEITADDEELLGELASALIPATDKPGAKEVSAHIFTFVMVDDFLTKEQKQTFMQGLREFNENEFVPGKKDFLDASPEERVKTLEMIESNGDKIKEPLKTFYGTARNYIIQGFTTSQYFLTEVKPYKLVPGPVYKGCVPLTEKI